MDTDGTASFYEDMGFEIVNIDDRDTLFYDLNTDGSYATVTDDDGNMPQSLTEPVLFTVYDDNDSFQWSATIKDSQAFKEYFTSYESTEDLLTSMFDIRSQNISHFDSGE